MRLILLCWFWIVIFFVLSLCGYAQETTHFPGQAAMDAQFGPEVPDTPHRVFTKTFWFAELVHASSLSVDSYATVSREGRGCFEGNNGFPEIVSGKELAFDGAVEFGAVFAGSALLRRIPFNRHWAWVTYLPQAYGTALHAHGAYQWYARC